MLKKIIFLRFLSIFFALLLLEGCASVRDCEKYASLGGCSGGVSRSTTKSSTQTTDQKVSKILEDAYRKNGGSELYIAILTQNLDKVKRLVSKGAGIESVVVMKKGANQYATMDLSQSALQIAVQSYSVTVAMNNANKKQKSKQIIRYFLDKGADVSKVPDTLLTAYDKSGELANIFESYRDLSMVTTSNNIQNTYPLNQLSISEGNRLNNQKNTDTYSRASNQGTAVRDCEKYAFLGGCSGEVPQSTTEYFSRTEPSLNQATISA